MDIKRLFEIPNYQLENFSQTVCLSRKEVDGNWKTYSTQDVIDLSDNIAKGLISIGIQPGDKVAIVSNNRPEWNLVDLGISKIGAISVPVYPTISVDDYSYIFNHAEVKACFVSDQELNEKVSKANETVPSLKNIYSFEKLEGVDHFNQLIKEGELAESIDLESYSSKVQSDDIVTIIYTSGTTGRPKGVMLTHANVMSNVIACQKVIPTDKDSKCLSFLPLCHIYERMLIYLYMYTGCSIYYAQSMDTIGDDLREVKPDIFTAVPRLLEKVFDKIMEKGSMLKGIKKALFYWAVNLGYKYEPYKRNGSWYEFRLSIARKLIFSKWQEAVGGNVKVIASGSAALSPQLNRIYNAAGIPVWEGYGLTETSPVVSVNNEPVGGLEFGTVGPVVDGVEVKIAKDGEILVKGPNVMVGYYKDDEKTKEVIDHDGFFHTGDIGEFAGPKKNLLKITDRKKEMFKTSGGKYVAPQIIENILKGSRFIEQAMVVGEGQKHPSALIVPEITFVTEWAKLHDYKFTKEELLNSKELHDRILKEVNERCSSLGKWEQPKKIIICKEQWTIEGGELTPTLKLKRKVLMGKYGKDVDSLYL